MSKKPDGRINTIAVDDRRALFAEQLCADLPSSWTIFNIGDLCNIKTGKLDVNQANEGGEYPFFTCAEKIYRINAYAFDTEAVLVAGNGFFNVKYYKGKFNAYQRTYVLSNITTNSKYLYYYINYRLRDITGESRGSTISYIRLGDLRDYPVGVAPSEQQKLIVAEIEKQFSRLDEAVANLKRVKANLKRYKAAVLKAAVEGKLTEEWRKEHPDVEPASKLLERILFERRKKWEEAELAKMKAKGKVAKDDKWKKKYKKPEAPEVGGLIPIPNNWVWASPAQLASVNEYSLAIGPFGSNLKVSDYKDEGVPLIFVRNIRTEVFDSENTKYVSVAKAKELKAHQVAGGDILITKMGDPPGDACLYPVGSPQAIITADCIKWKLSPHLPATEFFVNEVNSQLIKTQILQITKGVAQLKVSLARFKGVAFPLPPQEEQNQILNEVESRLTIIDAVEKSVRINLVRAEHLRQSILIKAFSGQLIN